MSESPTPGGAGRPKRLFRSVRRHHLVLAGVIDAAVSSGATFIVGLAATYYLQPEVLGGYALAFSVFVVSGFIPLSSSSRQPRSRRSSIRQDSSCLSFG